MFNNKEGFSFSLFYSSFTIQLPGEAQLSALRPNPAFLKACATSLTSGWDPVRLDITCMMYPFGIPASVKSRGACNKKVFILYPINSCSISQRAMSPSIIHFIFFLISISPCFFFASPFVVLAVFSRFASLSSTKISNNLSRVSFS